MDNHFQGSGDMKFANGDRYIGDWKDSQCCGKGTYIFKNGAVYEGKFVQDRFNGHGLLTWADGSWYEGEFREDLAWGAGTYRGVDDRIQTGHFHMGKYVGDYTTMMSNVSFRLPCGNAGEENTNTVESLASIETMSDAGALEKSTSINLAAPSEGSYPGTVFTLATQDYSKDNFH